MVRLPCQNPRCQGVDGACQFRLAFGFVHGGMRSSIDDDIGPQLFQRVGNACELGKVAAKISAVKVECDQLTQRAQGPLQLPADLTTLAEKHDLHARAM